MHTQGRRGGVLRPLRPWAISLTSLAGALYGARAPARSVCLAVTPKLGTITHQLALMIKAIANLTQQKNLQVRLRMAKMGSIEGIVARIQTLLITFLLFSLSHQNEVALAQKIETGFDSSFLLSTLQTFDFMKQERQSPDELATDADAESRIRENLASQLSAIGKRKTDTNPDFLVAFYAKSVAQTRWRTAGYGGQFGATAETYEVGTLVVDLVSRRDSRAVWRGVATKTLSSKKRNEKALREACAKLARQFKKDTEKQMKDK